MIELITIDKIHLRPGQYVPPFVDLLIAAARRGEALAPHVRAVVATFGFDSFAYAAWSTPHPDRGSPIYAYTTQDAAWLRRYDAMAYVDADPRLALARKGVVPVMWDQATVRGIGGGVDAFLDDALRHGIGSGVCFAWHGPWDSHMLVTLDSRARVNDAIRARAIARNLPDIVLFGRYFHEVFMLPALELCRRPDAAAPLSSRERECVALAARGFTTRDISGRLDISSRTVQFHFERIREKLGAANRHEAIARAVQAGVVPAHSAPPRPAP
jgi:LuxR family quorum-sensing system transcriptional regulator SolR